MDVWCVPSVGDQKQESWRFLVKERIAEIAKLTTLFLEGFEKKLGFKIYDLVFVLVN